MSIVHSPDFLVGPSFGGDIRLSHEGPHQACGRGPPDYTAGPLPTEGAILGEHLVPNALERVAYLRTPNGVGLKDAWHVLFKP